MALVFRESSPADIEAMFSVRGRTRQNPASRALLASYGITVESTAADMASGRLRGWGCFDAEELVGFCNGDGKTGEVLVLAVLAEHEGRGVGKRLLAHVVAWLQTAGFDTPWLAASPDPKMRAHGFYRSLGWRPSGELLDNGDEILRLGEATPWSGST